MSTGRISTTTPLPDAILKMAGKNLGAKDVCTDLVSKNTKVDPTAFEQERSALLALDILQVYEDRIWILWKNVCGQHTGKMIALLAMCAYKIGFEETQIDPQALDRAINHEEKINLDGVVEAVKKHRNGNFNLEAGR